MRASKKSTSPGRRTPLAEPAEHGLSLRRQAYEAIKRRIITLAYRPGAYLNEAQICEDLQIGRTPVHMAIERLMLEDLVQVIPRKGVIVKPLSLDEMQAITEARRINEPPVAALAATRASDEELKRLRQLVRQAKGTSPHKIEQLMELDREIHSVIAMAARNHVLMQILGNLHDRSLRQWFLSLSDPERQRDVLEEHDAVVRALEARDPVAAETSMRAHIDSLASAGIQYGV
jgi:DNA-binding GntR family transcriptional regulator